MGALPVDLTESSNAVTLVVNEETSAPTPPDVPVVITDAVTLTNEALPLLSLFTILFAVAASVALAISVFVIAGLFL